MPGLNPMMHMDLDYMWRWYITDDHGSLICMSAQAFFSHGEACRDFDAAKRELQALPEVA